MCVVWGAGVWCFAVEGDWLPAYVAVTGTFVEVETFDILVLSVFFWFATICSKGRERTYVGCSPEGKIGSPQRRTHAVGYSASLHCHCVDFVEGIGESEVGKVRGEF